MPYSPPCHDNHHSSIVCPDVRVKDRRIEKKYKAKAGILNTGLDCKCSSVLVRKFEKCSCTEAYAKGQKVVYEYDEEYLLDTLHECIEIVSECKYHHYDEEGYRKILHRLLELLTYLREVL